MNSSRSIGTCGPQKLDQTYRLPELRERTPLLWATTGGYQNPCRTFAEVSYALLCTVMQFATDVTAKNNVNSSYEPGGRGFKSCRARQISRTWQRKPSPPSCCGTVVGPLIHWSARPRLNSSTWPAKPGPPYLLWDPVGTLIHTSPLAVGDA